MIITIFANVVFVVSLIMLSFYFVTANIYDMTLMDKAEQNKIPAIYLNSI